MKGQEDMNTWKTVLLYSWISQKALFKMIINIPWLNKKEEEFCKRDLWNAELNKVKAVSLPHNFSESSVHCESPGEKYSKWPFTNSLNCGTLCAKKQLLTPWGASQPTLWAAAVSCYPSFTPQCKRFIRSTPKYKCEGWSPWEGKLPSAWNGERCKHHHNFISSV